MKLALINLDQKSGDPPLGLAYIASYVREYSRFKNNIIVVDKENIIKRIRDERPDVVGISSMSYQFADADALAKQIKKEFGVPLIIGGFHITSLPKSLSASSFDIGVIGEGEQTVLELMEVFDKFNGFPLDELRKINGLVFRNGAMESEMTPPRALIEPLERIPPPAFDLLPMKGWYLLPRRAVSGDRMGVYANLFTSRGCPYRCRFCQSSVSWKKLRMLNAERVVSEIKNLVAAYNVDGIVVWDDLFIADKQRLKEISKKLKEAGLDKRLHFSITARANLIDEEMCAIMKEMNVALAGFGLESGSEKILKYLKTGNVTVEDNRRALCLCKKHGIHTSGYFIIGSPEETEEDMKMTLELVRSPDLDMAKVFQLTPLPGTLVWADAEKTGLVSNGPDFDFRKLSLDFKPDMIMTKEMSAEKFKEWYDLFQEEIIKKHHTKMLRFELRHVKYFLSLNFLKKAFERSGEIINYLVHGQKPQTNAD